MKIEYILLKKSQIEDAHREIFAEMLKKQGKVQGNLFKKADRCKYICIANIDEKVAAIGAIKQKSVSDFSSEKAGVPNLSQEFHWELGYFYTKERFQGQKLASSIVHILLKQFGKNNLMASTEIVINPGMVRILENSGFRQYGNPWKSEIHGNYLGLFLRFK